MWLLAVAALFLICVVVATHRRLSFQAALLAVGVVASAGFGVALAPDVQTGYTVFRVAAAAVAFSLALARLPRVIELLRREIWLGLVLAWAVASLMWAPDLRASLVSWVGFAGAVLLGAVLASSSAPGRVAEGAMWLLAAACVVSTAAVWLLPSVATVRTQRPGEGMVTASVGLFAWNSEFGVAAALAAVLAAAIWGDRRHGGYLLLSLSMLAITFVTDSATALLAAAAGLVAVAWAVWRSARLLVVSAAAGVLGLWLLEAVSPLVAWVLSLVGRSADLTGRTVIWEYVLARVEQRPFIGYGVGTEPELEAVFGFAGHAHNGYLELLFNLGSVGAALFAASLVVALVRSTRSGTPAELGILAAFLVGNFANNFLVAAHLAVALYAWVAFSRVEASQRVRAEHPVTERASGYDALVNSTAMRPASAG